VRVPPFSAKFFGAQTAMGNRLCSSVVIAGTLPKAAAGEAPTVYGHNENRAQRSFAGRKGPRFVTQKRRNVAFTGLPGADVRDDGRLARTRGSAGLPRRERRRARSGRNAMEASRARRNLARARRRKALSGRLRTKKTRFAIRARKNARTKNAVELCFSPRNEAPALPSRIRPHLAASP